jgi:predicted methyltransferase
MKYFVFAFSIAACAPRAAPPPQAASAPAADPIAAAISASDRSEADRALDAGRKPAELLAFAGIQPGMKVAELGAATGYTTELLARLVGPQSRVYAQNSPMLLQMFAEKPLAERLKKPVNANVVRLDRDFDNPFPADLHDLDAVVIVLFYHDTVWMKTDRGAMNRAVLQALKPGGVYVIVDHSAAPGHGVRDAQTLHRIEEPLLRSEVEQAGFRFVKSADFLRNPADTRDWNTSPREAGARRGTSDRFVLQFVR